jgi:flagellar biosynthetic protein FliR
MEIDTLLGWMMVFLRSIGLVMLLPGPGGKPLPPVFRLGVALALTMVVYPVASVRAWPVELTWAPVVAGAVGEVVTGLALGFVGRFIFFLIETAGRIMASEIGLAAAPGFEMPDPAREPLASFISTFGILLFFRLGGHFGIIAAFARTFDLAAAGAGGLGPSTPEILTRESAYLIELAVRIAAPFIALNFLINLSFAILTRVVPKLNVFILSFPFRILGGFMLLSGSGMLIARYLDLAVNRLPMRLLEMVAGG